MRVRWGVPVGRLARRGWIVVVVAILFLPFGVPRFLGQDSPRVASDPGARFAKVCRDHGGTPAPASGAGTAAAQRRCTVRYGRHVYLMDAITPDGFDEDTARFQRRGCEEARRQERAVTARGSARRSFVYHPETGVCERRA
jgi:hypothetical protein